ncbi:MAG: hypothetical protein P4L53_22985 [Candidatus Obscuribacterales bacterium]|nr:hypothetical protein [Candidatus Obscuribacterales bacterium]
MKKFKTAIAALALISASLLSAEASFAHGSASPHATTTHRVTHPWRQAELLNDGTFAFMGSDNIWYLYSHQDGSAFVPSCIPDVYVLPKGGSWSKLDNAPAADTVTEVENTIIQWADDGSPANLQLLDFTCDTPRDTQ